MLGQAKRGSDAVVQTASDPTAKRCKRSIEDSHELTAIREKESLEFTKLLENLPSTVVGHLLSCIIRSPRPGFLFRESLERAADAYALCCNIRNFSTLFRSSVKSVHLGEGSSVNGKALARLFGSCLEEVVLENYEGEAAAEFLCTLAKRRHCLRRLSIQGPIVPNLPSVLKSLDKNSSGSLSSLCITVPRRFALFSEYYRSNIFASPARSLRKLCVDFAFIDREFLISIMSFCRGLEHIYLAGAQNVRTAVLCNFATHFRKTLRFFEIAGELEDGFRSYPLSHKDVFAVTSVCKGLEHIKVGPTIYPNEPGGRSAIDIRPGKISSLHLHWPNLDKQIVSRMAGTLQSLRKVNFTKGKPKQIALFCEHFGPKLEQFEIASKALGHDSTFRAIASCTNIRELTLRLPELEIDPWKTYSLDSSSMRYMFERIGPKLRKISWDVSARWHDLSNSQVEDGPEQLSGAELAKSLWTFCPSLEFVSVCKMEPRGVPNCFYFAAFDELRDKMPCTAVYLDEHSNKRRGDMWPGYTDSEEEMGFLFSEYED